MRFLGNTEITWRKGRFKMGYGIYGLTFNTLRGGNIKRLEFFKNPKGEFTHLSGVDTWTVEEWFAALIGELGEFANLHKKVRRGDFTIEEVISALADELADVQTYLDLLAARLRIDLGEATMKKWNAVSVRVGAPIYIDAEDWHFTENQGTKK